jgi:hypothetical protein
LDVWAISYFANANLRGTPVYTEVVTGTETLEVDWELEPPVEGLPAGNYSVRWSTTREFVGGPHRFSLNARGAMRLFVGGARVIQQWQPGWHEEEIIIALRPGLHRVVIEYAPGREAAELAFAMEPSAVGPGPIRPTRLPAPDLVAPQGTIRPR